MAGTRHYHGDPGRAVATATYRAQSVALSEYPARVAAAASLPRVQLAPPKTKVVPRNRAPETSGLFGRISQLISVSGTGSQKRSATSDRNRERNIARRQLSEIAQDNEDFVVQHAVLRDPVSRKFWRFHPVIGDNREVFCLFRNIGSGYAQASANFLRNPPKIIRDGASNFRLRTGIGKCPNSDRQSSKTVHSNFSQNHLGNCAVIR